MDLQIIQTALSWMGNKLALLTAWIILKLSNLGLKITPFSAKILNIIVLLILIFAGIKFLQATKPIIKYLIIFALIIFVISTGFSFL